MPPPRHQDSWWTCQPRKDTFPRYSKRLATRLGQICSGPNWQNDHHRPANSPIHAILGSLRRRRRAPLKSSPPHRGTKRPAFTTSFRGGRRGAAPDGTNIRSSTITGGRSPHDNLSPRGRRLVKQAEVDFSEYEEVCERCLREANWDMEASGAAAIEEIERRGLHEKMMARIHAEAKFLS